MKKSYSLSKEKINVFLLENLHRSATEIFRSNDYVTIERLDTAPGSAALMEKIPSVHLIGIRSRTKLTSDVLEKADKLVAIGCFCIGTDQVNLEAAAQMGIPVFNAPHSNTRSVAELVIGLSVMLMRSIFPKSLAAHHNQWIKSAKDSNELRGKVMGIVGYGHIGSQVSILAEAMGMRTVFYDIRSKLPLGNVRTMDSLESLLKISDVVTLHVPEDDSTINMMNSDRLKLMREKACLINASRGKVVDVGALAELLKTGKLRGAAVDVFPKEPSSANEAFKSPLIGLNNVILTPHIGGSTQEAQENIGIEVATKLVHFSDFGSTEGAVNFPNVNLRPHEDANRFLHIHENRPGLLRSINEVVAGLGINVKSQYLETKKQIGYVVLDIEPLKSQKRTQELRKGLESIQGTIRTRFLY